MRMLMVVLAVREVREGGGISVRESCMMLLRRGAMRRRLLGWIVRVRVMRREREGGRRGIGMGMGGLRL
jgi:hypothetical protein